MNILIMTIALIIVLSIYGGLNYYLYRYIAHLFPERNKQVKVAFISVAVVVLFIHILSYVLHGIVIVAATWFAATWLAFIFIFLWVHVSYDVVVTVVSFFTRKKIKHTTVTIATLATVFVLMIAGLYGAQDIEVKRVQIVTDKIERPYSIVQISDLHLGIMSRREQLRKVVQQVNELEPDIIVSTGDMIDMQPDNLEKLIDELSDLKAALAKFAVFGNHEAFAGIEKSKQLTNRSGFKLLSDSISEVAPFCIVGIDDMAVTARSGKKPVYEKKLVESCTQPFVLLLKHQPIVIKNSPYDLQLSGHTHGGQMFPFGLLAYAFYQRAPGLDQLDRDKWFYLSQGTGTWGPPMRLLAEAEITVIELKPMGSNR